MNNVELHTFSSPRASYHLKGSLPGPSVSGNQYQPLRTVAHHILHEEMKKHCPNSVATPYEAANDSEVITRARLHSDSVQLQTCNASPVDSTLCGPFLQYGVVVKRSSTNDCNTESCRLLSLAEVRGEGKSWRLPACRLLTVSA
ncbi:hypothetical protein VTN77DRAFT_7008 [Rasamsonia byssochlamydoides]|uniref:uncharacterized protein n=1 Tax=Rasamsonia byssochlamydoides TaxID=89139 RepID=UPI003741EB1B